jgi:hypothetical protein
MRNATLALTIGAVLLGAGCKNKDKENEAKKEKAVEKTSSGETGGENAGTTAANSGNNSGTTTGAPVEPTQKGCVNKLPGAEMPQGDITLTKACGAVTIEGDVTIDAKLTIEPGVTIAFVEGAGLYMGYTGPATLVARGTEAEPIVFTSAGDKVAGWWKGIRFYSENKRSVLDHVVIEHAGSDGDESGTALRVDRDVKDLEITRSTFRDGKGWGLWVEGEHSFTKVEGNHFSGLTVAAMRIHPGNLTELGANDVGDEPIELFDGNVTRSATMRAPGTYRLIGNLGVERTASNAGMPTLTIEPGVVVEAVSDCELYVGYGNAGVLKAEGTADKPITFTGFDKSKGSWDGIVLYGATRDTVIKHAVVEYAKSEAEKGAIQARQDASATLEALTYRHLEGVGLSHERRSKVTGTDLKVEDSPAAEFKPAE